MGMIIFTSQFSFSSHDGITYVWVKTTILLCFNLQLNGKKHIFFVCQTTTFSLLTLHWAFPFPPATPNTLWHTHPFQHTHQETFSKKKKRRTKQSNKNKWNVCVLKVMPKRSPEPCALAETPVTWRNGNRIIHFSNAHTHRRWILINRTAAWNLLQVMKPKCPETPWNWIFFFLGHINKLLLRGLDFNIDPPAAGVTSSSCERRPAASRHISSRPLEALTAARIIFTVLIYSSRVFEKPSFFGRNLICSPPFTCDGVNNRARLEGLCNRLYPPISTGIRSRVVCVCFVRVPSHVSSALILISFVDICHVVRAGWDCRGIFITVFGVCVTVLVGTTGGWMRALTSVKDLLLMP